MSLASTPSARIDRTTAWMRRSFSAFAVESDRFRVSTPTTRFTSDGVTRTSADPDTEIVRAGVGACAHAADVTNKADVRLTTQVRMGVPSGKWTDRDRNSTVAFLPGCRYAGSDRELPARMDCAGEALSGRRLRQELDVSVRPMHADPLPIPDQSGGVLHAYDRRQ